jgi:hypothetical protein
MKNYTIKCGGNVNYTVQVDYGRGGGVGPLRYFPTKVDADIWVSAQKAEDDKKEGRQWPAPALAARSAPTPGPRSSRPALGLGADGVEPGLVAGWIAAVDRQHALSPALQERLASVIFESLNVADATGQIVLPPRQHWRSFAALGVQTL